MYFSLKAVFAFMYISGNATPPTKKKLPEANISTIPYFFIFPFFALPRPNILPVGGVIFKKIWMTIC
jgi:hypothetical protein